MPDAAQTRPKQDEAPDVGALVRRACNGDGDAFAMLYERYRRSVSGGFQYMGLSSHESWDLTQETFLHAWRGLRTLETDEEIRFGGWIRTIAGNVLKKHWAAEQRRNTVRIDLECFPEIRDTSNVDPKRASIQREDHSALRPCLDTLSGDERCLVLLRVVHERSFRTIASIIGWAEATVRYRLKQALADLRSCLQQKGVAGI